LTIDDAVVLPNPVHGPQARLQIHLSGRSERLECRLYSVALGLVARQSSPGAAGPGWLRADLALPPGLSGGLYYVEVVAWRGAVLSQPKVLKLLYLP
jgi:hypothetical protein